MVQVKRLGRVILELNVAMRYTDRRPKREKDGVWQRAKVDFYLWDVLGASADRICAHSILSSS